EALRVVEDYCRFALDDAFLTRQLKEMRHELAQTLAAFDVSAGLAARDTLRDVGTTVSTPTEQARFSLAQVAAVNLKRLQEALRSLEEFGKLRSPDLGSALERLRYRSYTLERAVGLGTSARARLANVRLCVLLTGGQAKHTLDWIIQEAAE